MRRKYDAHLSKSLWKNLLVLSGFITGNALLGARPFKGSEA